MNSYLKKVIVLMFYMGKMMPLDFIYWIRIKLLKEHKRYRLKSAWTENPEGKYAVFAIYPGTTTIQSCLRILESLHENGFTVLVIVNQNRNSQEWLEVLGQMNCLVVDRPNLGRDFGAYQTGLRILEEKINLLQITKLVLVNDTAYISPKCQTEFLTSFFAQDMNNCLFKHFQGVAHASSNLIQIIPNKVDFDSFLLFWKAYYPYNSRIKVVFKGEHELSKKIGIEHLSPATKMIEALPPDLNPEERNQLVTWISKKNSSFIRNLKFQNYDRSVSDKLMANYAFANCQVSNSLGLYLARKYHFPLKLDLPYYLLASKASIIQVLKNEGCSNTEIKVVEKILESKGSINIGSPLQQLAKSFGLQS